MKILKDSHGQCCQVCKEAVENYGLYILIASFNNHVEKKSKLKILQIMNIERRMLSEIQCRCKRNRMQQVKEKRGQLMSWGKCTECRR